LNTENNKKNQLKKVADALLPTKSGLFHLYVFRGKDNKEHVALVMGKIKKDTPMLVRIHSECLTGDIFGSLRCDCGPQLQASLKQIKKEKSGILLYLRQEGRGIGLVNKIKAYALQDLGFDTVDANKQLGFEADAREYDIAALMLAEFGVKKIKLLTNNPKKIKEITQCGIDVVKRISIQIKPNKVNKGYLLTKKNRLGHLLDYV
jgi:3,4-dihydroxy 2-butanone 4-phosphate synthase/GTP cyclohydrolase II